MIEPMQRFKYAGPDCMPDRESSYSVGKSVNLCLTDNVVSDVQVFQKGEHNNLHMHLVEDGYWLVLAGRATFYGEGNTMIADLGKYEGLLIPRGNKYWFENRDDEPLEILRVDYRVAQGPRSIESLGGKTHSWLD